MYGTSYLDVMRNRHVAEPCNHRYGFDSLYCILCGQMQQGVACARYDGQARDSGVRGQTQTRQDAMQRGSRKVETMFEGVLGGSTFLFSDTHFDHTNIIKHCNRPFKSTNSMNYTLLKNWNHVIRNGNKIFFLGDMGFGRRRRSIDYWLSKLNGEIYFIRGNHDTDPITKATVLRTMYGIEYDGCRLLLMHDPERPINYDGWIVHGDKHNNNLYKYPFVNVKQRTINVCAEVVGYEPVSVSELVYHIRAGVNIQTRSYETHPTETNNLNHDHDVCGGWKRTVGTAHTKNRKPSKNHTRDYGHSHQRRHRGRR